MILIPRPFSTLQIQWPYIVLQIFTRHPLRWFFFSGSGVISPSCSSLGTRPSENWKEGLGDRLGSKCTEWNVQNL